MSETDATGRHERRRQAFAAPPTWKALLEYRALGERFQLSTLRPALRRLPHGDGHAVLVLPGFTADDGSTRPLRRTLRDLGYRVYGWANGINLGPTMPILNGLVQRLEHAHQGSGEPVSLIGWSLGGIYARELARWSPDLVRDVITLGSPIQMIADDRSGASSTYDALRRHHVPGFVRSVRDAYRTPLPVPNTSIYSRTDGVVDWRSALVERTANAENIRVVGSHVGLGFNAAAIYAIADRLAQPARHWSHFVAPCYLRGVFPGADDLDVSKLPGPAPEGSVPVDVQLPFEVVVA